MDLTIIDPIADAARLRWAKSLQGSRPRLKHPSWPDLPETDRNAWRAAVAPFVDIDKAAALLRSTGILVSDDATIEQLARAAGERIVELSARGPLHMTPAMQAEADELARQAVADQDAELAELIQREPLLVFFRRSHPDATTQQLLAELADVAISVARDVQRTPERTVILRKMLEATDSLARAGDLAVLTRTSPDDPAPPRA